MYLLVPAHPGFPRQSSESCKMVVCVLVLRLKYTSLFFLALIFITGAWECSPVLMAIHHSNGRFCDFLLFLFRDMPGGQTPQLIVTQNGLNDAASGKDVPFGVKLKVFVPPDPQPLKTIRIWPLLVWTWKIFPQFRFSIRGHTSKHP